LLFLSSYFPLALIFFVLFLNQQPVLASAILAAGILGLLGMFVYLTMVNRLEPTPAEVTEVRRRGAEVAGYILGYLLPFLRIPFEGAEQAIALTIFFLALCVVYVSSNMVYLNAWCELSVGV